jgi:transcriptional regulator with XRE-family HTH domain
MRVSVLEALHSEFAKRRSKNERYSLRAFARFLQLEPSYLSKVLRGHRRMSLPTITKIAERLRITDGDKTPSA